MHILFIQSSLNDFWENFIPDAVSTLIGTFLGFILAVLSQNYFHNKQARKIKQEQDVRVIDALRAIVYAVSNNEPIIQNIETSLKENKIKFHFPLHTSEWVAAKREILRSSLQVGLRNEITKYFQNVIILIQLYNKYHSFKYGVDASSSGDYYKKTLEADILSMCNSLIAKTKELVPMIKFQIEFGFPGAPSGPYRNS